MDIKQILKTLSSKYYIFHSEADFQFALAWEIKLHYPDALVRLEVSPKENPNMHIDILVTFNNNVYPIELKYKTANYSCVYKDEFYNLKNHSAQDLGRYDYLYDVKRIEILKSTFSNFKEGYAIFLTNDPSYWLDPMKNNETICDLFRIHNGNIIHGERSWIGNPSEGTTKGRLEPIKLNNTYKIIWDNFSSLDKSGKNIFKSLTLIIK